MKHSLPVLLASSNEDLRHLLHEMLGKHGFFHVLESGAEEETLHFFEATGEDSFALVHESLLTDAILAELRGKKNFLVLVGPDHKQLVPWTAQLGLEHFLSFPFSSRVLFEKISALLQ